MRGFASRCGSCRAAARPSPADRFWTKVDKNGPVPAHRPELGPCWLWLAGRSGSGYGTFWIDGKNEPAHRVAWELTHGPIPPGLFACHSCDNPLCCNAEAHLFLGTSRDNVADAFRKGRQRAPNIPPPHARGTAHHSAKLTEADVRVIRTDARAGVSLHALARRFGVHVEAVRKVVRGKTWAHLT
jgi:hypothetical protein